MMDRFPTATAIALTLGAILCGPLRAQTADPEEGAHLEKSSAEFEASAAQQVSALLATGFDKSLESTGLGAMSDAKMEALVKEIRGEAPIEGISVGKPGESYDIILQPGHYGRTRGAVGTAGKRVSERALNAHLVRSIAKDLAKSGLKVLVVPADDVASGLQAKVFLAIHADGSVKPCTTGPSLSYGDDTLPYAMHAVGYALALASGYDYEEFRRDNFTADAARYYMFRKVETTRLRGLLEVGELTCSESEDKVLATSRQISHNVALALEAVAEMTQGAQAGN